MRRPLMAKVVIYESQLPVLAGLRRRLQSEPGIEVAGAFADPLACAAACADIRPQVVVVSSFGPGAIVAANLIARLAGETKLIALIPGLRRHERLGYPPRFEFVTDGPRGDLLVARIRRACGSLLRGAVGHTGE
jgi:hypothetical protein